MHHSSTDIVQVGQALNPQIHKSLSLVLLVNRPIELFQRRHISLINQIKLIKQKMRISIGARHCEDDAYLCNKQVEVSVVRVQMSYWREQSVSNITLLPCASKTYLQYPTRKSDQSAHNRYAHTP